MEKADHASCIFRPFDLGQLWYSVCGMLLQDVVANGLVLI